jgi:asparagine synthase (glutamine-hydrolysing)
MCGICGIIHLNLSHVQEEPIRIMMHIMKHRGPDDDGVYLNDNLGFGFVRLSILDLSFSGHQPMFSSDGKFVVVYNGEIFNYKELRVELQAKGYDFHTNTDTEVLINAYIEWGEECQHKFNGMWAFAIYDIEKSHLFISRDRYGIKPFYYYQDENLFAFASEIPSLLKVVPQKAKANEQAIFDYLVFNRTDHNEETFFKYIFKLQHGHSLSILGLNKSPKIGQPKQWYDLKEKIYLKRKSIISAEQFKQLFLDAIQLRLRSDVPVGVCLSGGLDSSAIVSVLINSFDKKDLKTFSAVYEVGQHGDETPFINLYKSALKNMFYTTPTSGTLLEDLKKFIKIHAEPIPATGPYAQYKVMELAKKHVVVTLDGQGADEMLGGYHYFFGFYFKDLLRQGRIVKLSQEIYHYLLIHKSLFGIKSFVYFLLPKAIRTKVSLHDKKYINVDFSKKFGKNNFIAGEMYAANSLNQALLYHFEYKLEHLLKWEDRNSMAFSLEARVPFLDHHLVEATLSANGSEIVKNGMTKYLLRESMKGILPEEIRIRKDKIGFGTPQDEWIRTIEFQSLFNEIINSSSFRNRNFINIKSAKTLFQKHLEYKTNSSNEIWKLIHLELWFREFID